MGFSIAEKNNDAFAIPDCPMREPTSSSSSSSSSSSPTKKGKGGGRSVRGNDRLRQHFASQRTTASSRSLSSSSSFSSSSSSSGSSSLTLTSSSSVSSVSSSEAHDDDPCRIIAAAEALDHAGNDLLHRGHYKKAMNVYTRALKLKRRVLTETTTGRNDDEDNKNGHQRRHRDRHGEEFRDALIASIGTSMNNIGYLRQRSGKATGEETLSAYRDSLTIKREVLGEESLSAGKTLNNIGSVHFSNGEYGMALRSYLDALRILESHLGPDHLDVATIHSNIGDVHRARGQTDAALRHYRESMRCRWKLGGRHHPKVVRLLERVSSLEMIGVDVAYFKAALHESSFLYGDAGDIGARGDDRDRDAQTPRGRGCDPNPELADECHHLHNDVDDDISFIDDLGREIQAEVERDVRRMRNLEREAALDRILRKLDEMRRQPKQDAASARESHEPPPPSGSPSDSQTVPPLFEPELMLLPSLSSPVEPSSSPRATTVVVPSTLRPLSPVDRQDALSGVKDRLARLRESRIRGQQQQSSSS